MKDDVISRQAAIEAIEQLNIPDDMCVFEILSHIQLAIGTLPSAQPEKMQLSDEDATFDCISRQAAIDALHMHLMYRMGTDSNKKRLDEWINNLPSVQPEIIRCKDCKYWMRAYLSISGKHGCNVMRDYTAPDDYCFKAERKA